MEYITGSLKQKLKDKGVNLLSFIIIPFEQTKICIILKYEKNFFECKIHSNSLDIDYYNTILLCELHGKYLNLEQSKSFFNIESIFQSMKKRFPNHF